MKIRAYKLLLIDGNYKKEILITPHMIHVAKYPEQSIGQVILDSIKELERKSK